MYFLSPEEHKYVTRKLLMDARKDEVYPDLRGWNWSQPPIVTNSNVRLGVSDIASLYCSSSRDLYLKKVARVGFRTNALMTEGLFLHRVVCEIFTLAKVILYKNFKLTGKEFLLKVSDFDLLKAAETWGFSLTDEKPNKPRLTPAMLEKAKLLLEFESTRIAYRIDDIRSRYPYCETDAFVFLVLPVVVEQRLNGSFLGLSKNLAVDGFMVSQGMVADLKFDPQKRDFHKLTTTGYAMVMESLYEIPIDLGCIVYINFNNSEIRVSREFHHISDELRQWFLEERDKNIRMIENETDPGLAENCYPECPYSDICATHVA